MIVLKGSAIGGGYAFGRIKFIRQVSAVPAARKAKSVSDELGRYFAARVSALGQLAELYKKTEKKAGRQAAEIFEIHKMMLEDEDFNEAVHEEIEKRTAAEHAVNAAVHRFAQIFSKMDDEYMRQRSADVHDIGQRLIQLLAQDGKESGKGAENSGFESIDKILSKPHDSEKLIIAAKNLSPSETMLLSGDDVLAFITAEGSVYSHTAILARAMGLPAVIALGSKLNEKLDGKLVAVDACGGEIYIEPDKATLVRLKEKAAAYDEAERLLLEYRDKPCVTPDGKPFSIWANAAAVEDADCAMKNNAAGIGLFRSEFLFIGRSDFPTEDEQFEAYRALAQKMEGKNVYIRTLDIGADKSVDYFELENEANPALGFRALRICLERTDVFKVQLSAILRASAFGRVGIMIPMVASLEEVIEVKKIIEEVKRELEAKKIDFSDDVPFGIMVETPAAAIISDLLAPEVDFFSIGTNDLAQYTLAADRYSTKLKHVYNPEHPAVMRLIEIVCRNAKKYAVSVSVCGELAANAECARRFIEMGVDSLSVNPHSILRLKKALIEN